MDVNFFGHLKFIQPIVKRMVFRKKKGYVVIVGDGVQSNQVCPGMSPYACSKAALEQLAFQIAAEVHDQDISVHYFIPPPMQTKLLIE